MNIHVFKMAIFPGKYKTGRNSYKYENDLDISLPNLKTNRILLKRVDKYVKYADPNHNSLS